MTEEELLRLRNAANFVAARHLMLYAARLLRGALPVDDAERAASLRSIELKVSAAKADYLGLTFPEHQAAISDLQAGEIQEAFERLSAEFLATLAAT